MKSKTTPRNVRVLLTVRATGAIGAFYPQYFRVTMQQGEDSRAAWYRKYGDAFEVGPAAWPQRSEEVLYD